MRNYHTTFCVVFMGLCTATMTYCLEHGYRGVATQFFFLGIAAAVELGIRWSKK